MTESDAVQYVCGPHSAQHIRARLALAHSTALTTSEALAETALALRLTDSTNHLQGALASFVATLPIRTSARPWSIPTRTHPLHVQRDLIGTNISVGEQVNALFHQIMASMSR